MEKTEKYVSDMIDFERDIKPYHVIQVYAGVGAGKNTWIEKLVEEGHRVLLVTSRKVTADAQASKMSAFRKIDLDNIRESVSKGSSRAVVITNAGIEKYVKTKYDGEDDKTHLWKYFDIIVIDEAHSIAADATFSDAPFHVMMFIAAALQNRNCKVVLMTGTPEPLNDLISESFKESPAFKPIDVYSECHHVVPEEVIFYNDQKVLWEFLSEQINSKRRVVYFSNTINGIHDLVEHLKMQGVDERVIGISFSNDEKEKKFSDVLNENKDRVEKVLTEEEKIPDDIFLFATTSKNKEGINIFNEDIDSMVAETTERTALIQMAGRVRKGLKKLIVLYTVKQHSTDRLIEFEQELHKACLDEVNKVGLKAIEDNLIDKDNIVERIEQHFPYIRYDYIDKEFKIYKSKIYQTKRACSDNENVQKSAWQRRNSYDCSDLPVAKWFPESKIKFIFTPPEEQRKEYFKEKVAEYLERGGYLERTISKKERDQIRHDIIQIAQECRYDGVRKDAKNLQSVLTKAGYQVKPKNGHGDAFKITVITDEG